MANEIIPLDVQALTKRFGNFTAVDHVLLRCNRRGDRLSRSEWKRKDNHHPNALWIIDSTEGTGKIMGV